MIDYHKIIMAKPRAFSLKNSYLTGVLRNGRNAVAKTFPNILSVKDYIKNEMSPYFNLSQIQILEKLNGKHVEGNIPKSIGKMISDKIIGKDDELSSKNDLFTKTTYVIKNIPIDNNYSLLERLTFRNIVLSEFNEPWENSVWKSYFEEVTFILICYEGKGKKNGYRVLNDVRKISFSDEDIDKLGKSYEMVRNAIFRHDISLLPYPNSFDGQVLEIAPRGKKGDKSYEDFF